MRLKCMADDEAWGGRIVGSWSKRLRAGIVALACVVVAAATAGRAAAEGPPRPERSPSPPGTIQPEAAPGSAAAQETQKRVSSYQGSSTSIDTASSTQNARPAVPLPKTEARQPARPAKARVHRTAKKDTPFRIPPKPVASITATGGEILATSAHGLTKAPSSSESLLLLLVGLALVVLVVGETTFLRLAARGPAPRRAAEEPLPIRRVQLKR
jgi:cobalamin biosynthesis Mg chelatase CobN